jgi:tetratricopeptide (TPR) repeat protein
LHEGIAKNLEIRWRAKNSGFLSPATQSLLAEALRKDDFVTFEQMHPSFAKLPSAKMAQLAYAQVATLIDFLVQEKGGWQTLVKVLEEMSDGKDYEVAFAKIYHEPMSALLKEWKKWLKAQGFQEVKGLDPVTLHFVDVEEKASEEQKLDRLELAQVPSKSAREHLHLGDLLRYRGRVKGSITEYLRARDNVQGVSPIIATKLGQAYNQIGEFEKTSQEMQEVLRYYPQEGLAFRLLGDAQLGQKKYKEAGLNFERALHINPFNPFLYHSLHQVQKKLGHKDKAQQAKRSLEILNGGI